MITMPSVLIFFNGLGEFYWFSLASLMILLTPLLACLFYPPQCCWTDLQNNKTKQNKFLALQYGQHNYKSMQSFPPAPLEPRLLQFLEVTHSPLSLVWFAHAFSTLLTCIFLRHPSFLLVSCYSSMTWALLSSKSLPWPTSHPQLWSQTCCLSLRGITFPSLACWSRMILESCSSLSLFHALMQTNMATWKLWDEDDESLFGRVLISEPPLWRNLSGWFRNTCFGLCMTEVPTFILALSLLSM